MPYGVPTHSLPEGWKANVLIGGKSKLEFHLLPPSEEENTPDGLETHTVSGSVGETPRTIGADARNGGGAGKARGAQVLPPSMLRNADPFGPEAEPT